MFRFRFEAVSLPGITICEVSPASYSLACNPWSLAILVDYYYLLASH